MFTDRGEGERYLEHGRRVAVGVVVGQLIVVLLALQQLGTALRHVLFVAVVC